MRIDADIRIIWHMSDIAWYMRRIFQIGILSASPWPSLIQIHISDTFQIIKIILDIKSQNWTPPKKKKKNYLRWQRQRGIKNAAEYGKGPESVTEQIRDTCPANWGRLKATSWRKDTNPISDISGNTKAQLDCANSRQIGTLTVKCKRLLCGHDGHKSRLCCPSFLHQYQYFP